MSTPVLLSAALIACASFLPAEAAPPRASHAQSQPQPQLREPAAAAAAEWPETKLVLDAIASQQTNTWNRLAEMGDTFGHRMTGSEGAQSVVCGWGPRSSLQLLRPQPRAAAARASRGGERGTAQGKARHARAAVLAGC